MIEMISYNSIYRDQKKIKSDIKKSKVIGTIKRRHINLKAKTNII